MEPKKQQDDCIRSIRALLTSTKNGLSIQEILNDYRKMEGKTLPFKTLGFNTLDELLRDSNQFVFNDTKQGWKVTAKPSKDSQHMQKLVQSQKASYKPKKKTNMLMPNRSLQSSTNDNDNEWNTTVYAKVYNKLPNRSVKKVSTHPAKLLQATFASNGNAMSHKRANNNYNNTDETPSLRPILKQSNIKPVPNTQTNDSKPSYYAGNGVPAPQSRPLTGRTHSNNIQQSGPNQARPTSRSGEKTSVNARLAVKKPSTNLIVQTQPPLADAPALNPDTQSFVRKAPTIKHADLQKLPPINAVALYCQQKGYPEPEYSYSRTKSRNYTCKVTVGRAMYASYPNEFSTEAEAQYEAARIAMQHIRESEFTDQLPICMDSVTEIANKIFDSLEGNGVFLKFIPEIFQKKFELILPDHWMTIILDNPQMFSIVSDSVTDRVYPNIRDGCDTTDSTQQENYKPDELVLPWNEKHWNVYITSVSSTVDVWGRLIGPEYSMKLDSILDDIEAELLSSHTKQPCANLTVGRYCYITNPDCRTELHRVRVEKIEGNEALCFLIDYGDQEWRPLDQIYDSDSRLFRLPAQAIRFSLYNLEDFAENTHANREIDEHLAGKTLIAEIKSSESEYSIQCESSDMDAKVKAIFYDTSSDEDIQLNKVILHKICANAEPPQLERTKWNSVYITHITDNGEIYCQLHNKKVNTIHNIKQLIYRLTQNGIDEQYRIAAKSTGADFTPNQLYLIFDDSDSKWYRAAILPTQNPGGTTECCKYIDFGIAKTVAREHIYRLDKLSTALSKYPHQAILVRLNDIKMYNARIVARLRGLLCSKQPVLVQVAGYSATIPMVTICKRLESEENTILCNINDTIRMEQEIENSPDFLTSGDDSFASISSIKITAKPAKLQFYPEPSLDEYFNVIVVTAPNPSNFFIRPRDDENKFQNMMLTLSERCKKNRNVLSTDDIEQNQYYAGQSNDGYWYRVKVQKILSDDQLVVYKCDYGSIDLLRPNALRSLDADFKQMPQLAIKANSHGIQPRNSVWNIDDCDRFQQRTVGHQFAAQIKAIRKDTSNNQQYILELVLIDESNYNVNEELVKEQRAIPV